MSDTTKYETVLNIECLFLDSDTRTITLKNPKSDITSSKIQDLELFMLETKIIIGDRDGSDFGKIKRAVKRNTSTWTLDLDSI